MTNKEIVLELIRAFDTSDTEAILKHLTDDIEWNIVGDQVISGKDEMQKFFANHADMEMITSTKNHIIIDGDQVVVDGIVQCSGKDDQVFDMHYCDIYELENGLVKKMTSYIVTKKE